MKEYNEEDYLMLSGIQHFAFCRRQWALIHIEQQWQDNYRTTSGELLHKRAHDESLMEKRGNLITARGLRIASSTLGMSGQCDVVEFHQDDTGISLQGYDGHWSVYPVEYKRGCHKDGEEDEVQLCAQAICLEEMLGTKIDKGAIYYGENRRREEILFSDELRARVYELTEEMHQLFRKGYTPKSKPKKKCMGCSLKNLCLPKMQGVEQVEKYFQERMKVQRCDVKR